MVISTSLCNEDENNPLKLLKRKPSQYHVQRPDGHYEYGYFTGNSAKYEVKTTDGITRGSYSYTDPNAVLRVTNYVADNTHGFRARNTEHGAAKNTGKELYSHVKRWEIFSK